MEYYLFDNKPKEDPFNKKNIEKMYGKLKVQKVGNFYNKISYGQREY